MTTYKQKLALLAFVFLSASTYVVAKGVGTKPAAEEHTYEAWKQKPKEPFSDGAKNFEAVKKELLAKYVDQGITEDDLYRGAVAGMLQNIDPEKSEWNRLISPTEYAEMMTDMKGEVTGVGIAFQLNESTGYAEVLSVVPDTAAAKAGIKTGDQVLRVDGKSFKGKQMRDFVYQVRGKAGTAVELMVMQDEKIRTIKLKRAPLRFDTVDTTLLPDGMAVVYIHYFTEKTPGMLKDALQKLRSQNVKGVVLDLRGNSGGLFDKMIESIAHLVPNNSPIVVSTGRGKQNETIRSKGEPLLPNVPLAVLVNNSTMSGAEMMAAALKVNAKATIVGQNTFGKWSAQRVEELPNKYAIKYTTANFMTPSGSDLNGVGLSPDIVVDSEHSDVEKWQKTPDAKERLNKDIQLRTAVRVLQL